MDRVTVDIRTEGEMRASETVPELRAAAEALYAPMRLVGFWDGRLDIHLCPHEERKLECPHRLPESDPQYVKYAYTLQRQRKATLEVVFPHADMTVYLA